MIDLNKTPEAVLTLTDMASVVLNDEKYLFSTSAVKPKLVYLVKDTEERRAAMERSINKEKLRCESRIADARSNRFTIHYNKEYLTSEDMVDMKCYLYLKAIGDNKAVMSREQMLELLKSGQYEIRN